MKTVDIARAVQEALDQQTVVHKAQIEELHHMFQDLQITRDRYSLSMGTYKEQPTLIARPVQSVSCLILLSLFFVRFARYQNTMDPNFKPYKNVALNQHKGPVMKCMCSISVAKTTVDSLNLPFKYMTFSKLFSNGLKDDCPETAYTKPARQFAICLQAWEDRYTRAGHKLDELDLDLVDQPTRSTERSTDIDGCNSSSYAREFLSNVAPQLWWTRALDGSLCFVLGRDWMPEISWSVMVKQFSDAHDHGWLREHNVDNYYIPSADQNATNAWK